MIENPHDLGNGHKLGVRLLTCPECDWSIKLPVLYVDDVDITPSIIQVTVIHGKDGKHDIKTDKP